MIRSLLKNSSSQSTFYNKIISLHAHATRDSLLYILPAWLIEDQPLREAGNTERPGIPACMDSVGSKYVLTNGTPPQFKGLTWALQQFCGNK